MEHGAVGDRIVVESEHVGESSREGEIVEVLGSGDATHYAVRWDDGHKTTFFPSVGSSQVIRAKKKTPRV